ncbi:MAG: SGNH/GDSL hydrolase family protein [Opitutales bacterium]
MRLFPILLCLTFLQTLNASMPRDILKESKNILFLGDSITQRGTYVSYFESWLVNQFPDLRFEIINAGLGSETVSGLSEEGHAKGKFPRPCIFERLERVLAKTHPDLIIACYGMNCGIYLELDEERFDQYRHGLMRLRAVAKQYGAEVIHVTPPIYDNKGKRGFDYDDVLSAYSSWLVEQREQGWLVADLHSEMRAKVDFLKDENPRFTVQKDKVHPNDQGHWMMAESLFAYFGKEGAAPLNSVDDLVTPNQFQAIHQRMQTFQKAIHAETKPLRPGVPMGGDLETARDVAKQLESAIYLTDQ